jgi:hypothetical protein
MGAPTVIVMRIESSPGTRLSSAFLWLTAAEASELRGAIDDMLATDQTDWHAHVSSADYQRNSPSPATCPPEIAGM